MLEIRWFDRLNSTQKKLIADLKAGVVKAPIIYATKNQQVGIGSRGNVWIGLEGNLFFSLAWSLEKLPQDLKLQSASIYFAYLLKEKINKDVWIKWPNDFYIGDKKCGGVITSVVGETLVCGIGLNTIAAPKGFEALGDIDEEKLLLEWSEALYAKPKWKDIFSKFQIEFQKSRLYKTHVWGREISLLDVELADDGALIIGDERVYSLR